MRFKHLLKDTCTLTFGETVIGRDEYNAPIFAPDRQEEIQCRFDQFQEVVSRGEFGAATVTKTRLFLLPGQKVSPTMVVSDIKDANDNVLTVDSFNVADLGPKYGKRNLHHYEVTLRKSENGE
jgi:hypothetical protein